MVGDREFFFKLFYSIKQRFFSRLFSYISCSQLTDNGFYGGINIDYLVALILCSVQSVFYTPIGSNYFISFVNLSAVVNYYLFPINNQRYILCASSRFSGTYQEFARRLFFLLFLFLFFFKRYIHVFEFYLHPFPE